MITILCPVCGGDTAQIHATDTEDPNCIATWASCGTHAYAINLRLADGVTTLTAKEIS